MRKVGGPGGCCCVTTCTGSVTFCVTAGCCLAPAGITINIQRAGVTIASGVTARPFASCTAQNDNGCGCTISYVGTPGEALTWTLTDATYGTFSGTFTASCSSGAIPVSLWGYGNLPATLYLNDPVGNAIALTKGSGNTWTGTHTYMYTDAGGIARIGTLGYTWGVCPQANCGSCYLASYPSQTTCDLNIAWHNGTGACPDLADAGGAAKSLSASLSDGVTMSKQCSPPLFVYQFAYATQPDGAVTKACSAAPFMQMFRGAGATTFSVTS